jgi:hypothetical protein
MGFGLMIGFIEYLYIQLVPTSNYSAIADVHTLHMTSAHTKSSQSAFTSCFVVMNPSNGDSSASVLMLLPD